MSNHSELKELKKVAGLFLRDAGIFTYKTLKVSEAFLPITQLVSSQGQVESHQLTDVLDRFFDTLYDHPVTQQTRKLTTYLRNRQILPNEESTEHLIRYLVEQMTLRSPVPIPEVVIQEFWHFFQELLSDPELKGLADLNLDIIRLVLQSYEPLLLEVVNLLREMRSINQDRLNDLVVRVQVIRGDLKIIRRQIKALRYIKPFFQTDPKDFQAQAQIIAKMVQEFGTFFIKIAQVAATTSDFLPTEIAKELMVFQEDVSPMEPQEVLDAFQESRGCDPRELYFGFDCSRPIKSGSIGSIYLAKKPFLIDGKEVLIPVVVKVRRYNLDREFLVGNTVLGLALLSSQYWAPHSKLAPFLSAMQQQVGEFVCGFENELNFENEAALQERFLKRSYESRVWTVPKVYHASPRVLEMEYLEGYVNISQAMRTFAKDHPGFSRQLGGRFLYTIMMHLLIYQEFHGDLHGGNVMVNPRGELSLIDWGNVIPMEGKWQALGNYLLGAFIGDTERLTESLIALSTNPEVNRTQSQRIQQMLEETLRKKNIVSVNRQSWFLLVSEGLSGWHRRQQVALQLMSNTQHLGIVIRSEYLHLSRSIMAMIGTYNSIYAQLPRLSLVTDLANGISQFPLLLIKDRFEVKRLELRQQLKQSLPFKNNLPSKSNL